MSVLSRAALSALTLHVAPPPRIRAAVDGDLPAIDALMAPHVASGLLLPRSAGAAAFLVADGPDGIEGCVAVKPWTADVHELGSLVAARSGAGLGRQLVEAAALRARAEGAELLVALTGSPAFFERCGWRIQTDAPWARARGFVAPAGALPELPAAVQHKSRSCAACPRLAGCSQALLATRLEAA